MRIDLRGIANWLQRAVRPGASPQEVPSGQRPQTPPFVPAASSRAMQPEPTTLYDTPEYLKASQQRDAAFEALNRPAPAPAEAQLDPVESILSAFLSTQTRLPSAQTQLGALPIGLAEDRAARQTEQAMARYNQEQSAAALSLRSAEKMIGELYDRDAITQKLKAQREQTILREETKKAIAQGRQNMQLGQTIATLGGKGQLNEGTLAQALMTSGYTQDFAAAQQMAQAMIADIAQNPSAWLSIQQAETALKEQKQNEVAIQNDLDILGKDASETTLPMKLAAANRLIRAGVFPEGIDPMAVIQATTDEQERVRALTRKTNADTALSRKRAEKVDSDIKVNLSRVRLNDANRDLVRKKVDFYDDEFAVRAARAYSQVYATYEKASGSGTTVDDLKKQIENFEQIARLADAQLESTTDSTQFATLRDEAVAARKEASRLRTELSKALKAKADESANRNTGGGGAKAADSLREEFGRQFPGARVEQWADRDVRGRPGVKSMHASGEALDLYGPLPDVHKWAMSNPNVGLIIYNGQIWRRQAGGGWKQSKYSGVDPHKTHIHIEPMRMQGPPAPPAGSGRNASRSTQGAKANPKGQAAAKGWRQNAEGVWVQG